MVGTEWPDITDRHSQTDAGTYGIIAAIANNTNFVIASDLEIGTMTVAKATLAASDFTVTIPTGLVYDMEGKAVISVILNNGDTLGDCLQVKYCKTIGGTTTEYDGPVKDAGEYQIKLYCDETKNYNKLKTGDADGVSDDKWIMTIEQAVLTVESGSKYQDSWTYNGMGQTIGFTVKALSGDMTDIKIEFTKVKGSQDIETISGGSIDHLDFSRMFTDVADSGEWTWKADAGSNYKILDSTNDTKVVVSISKANLTVTILENKYENQYSGQSHVLHVKVEAVEGNNITLKWDWTQTHTELAKSVSVDKEDGSSTATLDWTIIHVSDSGTLTWEADAGNNYNVYKSSENSGDLTANVTPYELNPIVAEGSGTHTYDGQPHAFDVKYDLIGQDAGKETDYIQVTYGMSAESADGDIDVIQQTYYTADPVTAYYKLSYNDSTEGKTAQSYGDYSFPVAASSKITIQKLQMEGEISLDGDVLEDSEKGIAGIVEYNGEGHILTAMATNLQTSAGGIKDEATVRYVLYEGGTEKEVSEEELASLLSSVGTYTIKVTVTAKSGEDVKYRDSYTPYERTVTVEVTIASVKVTDFSYGTVTEGDPMTMEISLESVGTLVGKVIVMYRGEEIPVACTIADKGNGVYIATLIYDTSLGIIPSGTLQTISVYYGGDDNHKPSEEWDQVIRIRSAGMPVIPEDGGQVPIDPEQGSIEVVTPAGDIRFDIIDAPALEDGDTIVIDIIMRYSHVGEEISGAEKTIVLCTKGYVLHADGSETPIRYRITPSVNVEIPSGKKPVIALYDMDGSQTGSPDVLTYTSDFATFQADVDGSISAKIGVTFASKFSPDTDPDDPVPVHPPKKTAKETDYTPVVIAGCVAALMAILAVFADSRSRN